MNAPSQQWLAELGKSSNSKVALESIVQLFIANTGTLHRIGPDGFLHLIAIVGNFPPPVMDAIRTIPVGNGLAGLAAERRGPVTVCNLQTEYSDDLPAVGSTKTWNSDRAFHSSCACPRANIT